MLRLRNQAYRAQCAAPKPRGLYEVIKLTLVRQVLIDTSLGIQEYYHIIDFVYRAFTTSCRYISRRINTMATYVCVYVSIQIDRSNIFTTEKNLISHC